MKIHRCYFCNYETRYKNNFINHVTKQKKCNYLINSIPINSIEDYYNLRDLHKKDPDNEMWGEDDSIPPQNQYYNSDDDELDENEKQLIEANTEYIDNLVDSYFNKSFNCNYCNKRFNRKDNLKRHYSTCKIKKQKDKEYEKNNFVNDYEKAEAKYKQTMKDLEDKELVDQILLLKGLMDQQEQNNRKMAEEIKYLKESGTVNTDNSIINTNSNNVINNNTQINNKIENKEIKNKIIINNFGSENKEIFSDEDHMFAWLDAPFNAIPNMVEKLHFTPKKRPENNNIRINNISNGKAQIYKNGNWKTVMKHELIYDLITECANKLIDTYELYVEEGKIQRMARFEKFMKQYEQDDQYFVRSQTEKVDCKLIDLMKKHKTYLNSLS